MSKYNPLYAQLGVLTYFLREGETSYPGLTISETVRPSFTSGDPIPSDLREFTLGCAQGVATEKDTTDNERSCTDPDTGAWVKEKTEIVEADYLDVTLADYSSLIWELFFGVADPFVDGVCQTPFAKSDRSVKGWFFLRGTDSTNGTGALVDGWYWGKMTLKAFDGFKPEFTDQEVRLQVLPNVLNQVCPIDIVG